MATKEENKVLIENPEVIQEKLENIENWAEGNIRLLIGIVAVIVLAVGGFFGWRYYIDNQEVLAQKEMFQAVYYFEADSLNLALNGDGNNLGLLRIIDDYGMTNAANLANFYAGVIHLKQNKYPLAIFYLTNFKSGDLLIQARSYSLVGDAYMEQKNFDKAAEFYDKASHYKPNKQFSPVYLMKLALAYEKLKQNDKAIKVYNELIDTYWDSSESVNAKKCKARLENNNS